MKVNKQGPNDCWEWTASKRQGYGLYSIKNPRRVTYSAHRYSFFLAHGYWPECCCHACDNPGCVNPRHLFEASHAENMADMKQKGRAITHRGEKNGNAKLTESQVIEIRQRYVNGDVSYATLAKEYEVDPSLIGNIVNKKMWKHIGEARVWL